MFPYIFLNMTKSEGSCTCIYVVTMGCTRIGWGYYQWNCTNVSKATKYLGGVIKYDLLQMFTIFKFNTKRGHKIWPSTCVWIFKSIELFRHRLLISLSDDQQKIPWLWKWLKREMVCSVRKNMLCCQKWQV